MTMLVCIFVRLVFWVLLCNGTWVCVDVSYVYCVIECD